MMAHGSRNTVRIVTRWRCMISHITVIQYILSCWDRSIELLAVGEVHKYEEAKARSHSPLTGVSRPNHGQKFLPVKQTLLDALRSR